MSKLIVFSIIFIAKFVFSEQRVDVDILYESLCPDSLNFIKHQLRPAWKDIKDYVNLNLVPFGKSASTPEASFDCQHGPRECQGNKIMSCALYKIQDPSLQVNFTHCYMNLFMKYARRNKHEFGQSCVLQAGLDWDDDIKSCYESNLGTLLQLNAEKLTKTHRPQFIPTVVYNKRFNQELQDNSLDNFKGVVCSLIKESYPFAC